MCGFQNSNIDICKNKPQKYATKIPTTKQKGIHTSLCQNLTAYATKLFKSLGFVKRICFFFCTPYNKNSMFSERVSFTKSKTFNFWMSVLEIP